MNEVDQAILGFGDWSVPWQFRQYVCETLRSQEAREMFDAVWSEAISASHWQSTDLVMCARHAEAAVIAKFPTLSRPAVSALAKAAAYQWK